MKPETEEALKREIGYTERDEKCEDCKHSSLCSQTEYKWICNLFADTIGVLRVNNNGRCFKFVSET